MKYKFRHITGHVHIVEIWNHRDHTGEYEGGGQFRFALQRPMMIPDLNGKSRRYTHVHLNLNDWMSGACLVGDHKLKVEFVPTPQTLSRDMYEALSHAEQGSGKLKDWCFSDELEDAAFPKRNPWASL